jgi:putative transposase
MISLALKTELDPSGAQRELFERCAGAARFVWNWGLGRKQEVRQWNQMPTVRMKYPSAMDLHKELVRAKQGPFAWLYDLPKSVAQESLRDLDKAYTNLFKHGYGWPKFKSKKWAKKSFRVNGDAVEVADNSIRLPVIGWVRLKEKGYLLPEEAVHLLSVTVSERAGKWFVSVSVEDVSHHKARVPKDAPVVGIDVGLTTLATLSNGLTIESPRALRTGERKMKRLQRAVSRKQKGSANRQKAIQKLQRCHLKITNVRRDALNKATTGLAKAKSVYVVEDLSVRAMMGNHHLAKSIADASWTELVRQLEYKAAWYGSRVVKADRFFPSTKRCSSCGLVKDTMPLGERTFRCERCGMVADRDLNASRNLQQWPSVRRTLETPVKATTQVAREAGIVVDVLNVHKQGTDGPRPMCPKCPQTRNRC